MQNAFPYQRSNEIVDSFFVKDKSREQEWETIFVRSYHASMMMRIYEKAIRDKMVTLAQNNGMYVVRAIVIGFSQRL